MLRFVLCHIYHYFSSKEIKWKLLKRLKLYYFLFFESFAKSYFLLVAILNASEECLYKTNH